MLAAMLAVMGTSSASVEAVLMLPALLEIALHFPTMSR